MKDLGYPTTNFHRAYKLAKLAWWEFDLTTQILTLSEDLIDMYGLPDSEGGIITLQTYFTYVHPDDVLKVEKNIFSTHLTISTPCEYRIVKPSGEMLYVINHTEVVNDSMGIPTCIVGTVQDISKQKEIELQIKLSEQKYKLLFNQSLIPKLIFHIDTYRIVEVNEAAVQQYGYSREDFLNLTIIDLRPPDDRAALYNAIDKYRNKRNEIFTSVHRHMKKSGELFFVHIAATIVDLPTGLHSVVIASDMTEKLQMQQRIINEKVMAQKEMAKAIIQTQEKERQEIGKELHDNVNQILTTIKLYIENIKSYPEHQSSFIDKSVTLTQKAINELRLLSKQLVTPVINDLNFKAAIIELVDHYKSLYLFRIDYSLDIDEDQLDRDIQLTIYRIIQEQLNNIVKHAKATLVTITVSDIDCLNVSVIDNGIGFNTSQIGEGMGLNNIKNRAEIFKGKVYIKSSIGNGCNLNIEFPNIKRV